VESDPLGVAPPATRMAYPLTRRGLLGGTAALGTALFLRAIRLSAVEAQRVPAQTTVATVNSSDGLHLRSGPGESYDSLAVMPGGAQVNVTGPASANNWLPVQYNGQAGWADADYLTLDPAGGADPQSAGSASTSLMAAAANSTPAQPSTATVVPPDGLNLRGGPGTDNPIVTVIPGGASVNVTAASAGGWTPVSYNGSSGWVESAYLSGGIFATTASGATVVAAGASSSGAAMLAPTMAGAAASSNATAYGNAAAGIAGPPEVGLTPTAAPAGTLGRFIWPIDSRQITTVFQPAHQAIDIADPVGNPVHAIADGVVSFAGGDPSRSYGLYVIVQHPGGFSSLVAHLGSMTVKQGDVVKQNDMLGKSGVTGRTTGPHVHFAIYYQGAPLNPLTVLPADKVQIMPGANDVA
jgi:murein DD-endopeptidase MepM/ murein hydrolase activator NlpD